ncbi:M23 family metallopeptidase [Mycobacterium sp. PS03-16]|uniref:murein hydrolase activator EnvC family protein n=1 Tax=Mycobacterium sp. PS03-16 TaxID=2559611 RepID=UPI0010749C2A|nr:M23 family metallopeptidase [Mycobacterium sp. PS03-16]TFV56480.1 M23 family metallopeptidase [Mycobacterium sp. PS03-16]
MRVFVACVVLAVAWAAPVRADDGRLDWPLRPRPAVLRTFDAPALKWQPGHRGVDLAARPGQEVRAARAGTVVFAGELAGRPLVSVAHPGGLRTTYEPVAPSVRAGQTVATGAVLGAVVDGHAGCPAAACLHWGAMWGPASRTDYVDPLGLLTTTEIRLKPLAAGPSPAGAISR